MGGGSGGTGAVGEATECDGGATRGPRPVAWKVGMWGCCRGRVDREARRWVGLWRCLPPPGKNCRNARKRTKIDQNASESKETANAKEKKTLRGGWVRFAKMMHREATPRAASSRDAAVTRQARTRSGRCGRCARRRVLGQKPHPRRRGRALRDSPLRDPQRPHRFPIDRVRARLRSQFWRFASFWRSKLRYRGVVRTLGRSRRSKRGATRSRAGRRTCGGLLGPLSLLGSGPAVRWRFYRPLSVLPRVPFRPGPFSAALS